MPVTDRSRINRHDTPAPGRIRSLFAAILLLALAAALALRVIVTPDALAPAVATLLFVLAAATAAVALACRRGGPRLTWFDIAGILAFVGIVVSILIEPDQIIRLVAPSDQPD